MASRTRKRVDRIKAKVPIAKVLYDLGYNVRPDGGDREQQFPCDLHGDGLDNKPSARVYPVSASSYCFVCDKTRDAVETVRAKKGLGFMDALKYLEDKYGLEPLPWEEGDTKPPDDDILRQLDPHKTFADEAKLFQSFLSQVTSDRDLLMEDTLTFWEAFDHLTHLLTKEKLTETKSRAVLASLQKRLSETVTRRYSE